MAAAPIARNPSRVCNAGSSSSARRNGACSTRSRHARRTGSGIWESRVNAVESSKS